MARKASSLWTIVSGLIFVLGLLILQGTGCRSPKGPGYDLLILDGRVIDGTGNPAFRADVAVRDGRIVAVGRNVDGEAQVVIEARGKVVAPGFIDMHSHSDLSLLVDGNAESKIRQGVTTEILGESGSAGPLRDAEREERNESKRPDGVTVDWTTLGGYFRRLERETISVNVASYVGSGRVRMAVMGNVDRAPSPEEFQEMRELVKGAMQDGALGVSSGLIYPPNAFATTEELIGLAEIAAQHGGIYTSHIRAEGANILLALDEAIEVGEKAGCPVHILHLKVVGKSMWGRMESIAAHIQAARRRGVEVTANQYPYVASMTGLRMALPLKFLKGTTVEFVERLKSPQVRREIRDAITNGLPGWESNRVGDSGGWKGVLVASVNKPENKKYEGKRMSEVAAEMKKDPVDALCDLLVSEEGRVSAIYFAMSEADVRLGMQQPWVSIGSDGSAVNPSMSWVGKPHPRWYGTHPRVLGRYVRVEKVLTLPDAIRKMTSLPAQILGFDDRGLLKPGFAADIVVFDPETVLDQATFEDPHQYPVGIETVIVNGQVVIDQGNHTGARPGRVLYGGGRRTSCGG